MTTQADLDKLKREWQEAVCRSFAVPPRILGLKRTTRARWWLVHRIDGIAIWLAEHDRDRAAILLWRVFGLW